MRRLLLPISAVAVIAAVIVLALQVRARPDRRASDKERANAEAKFRRQEGQATPVLDRAKRASTAAAGEPAPAPVRREAPPEPPPEPEPELSSIRMNPASNDLEGQMDEANRLFDRGDYPSAEEAALAILGKHPGNIRMLRIVVSTACATGNIERAKEYYGRLPSRDQEHMRARCDKWGIRVGEAPAAP